MIGCSRSGTTLVADMLGEHPGILNWSEAGQFIDLRYFRKSGHHRLTKDHVTDFHRRRLQMGFLLLRLLSGSIILNKNPANSLRIPFLAAIFRFAVFIQVIRDGRAVINSSLTQTVHDRFRAAYPLGFFPRPPGYQEWSAKPLHIQFARQWRTILETIEKDAGTLRTRGSYSEIRYEDFCTDARSSLQVMDEFCGVIPSLRPRMETLTGLPSQNFKWQESWDSSTVRDIEHVLGRTLERHGYEVGSSSGLGE